LLNLLKQAGCRVAGTQLSKSAADFARRRFGIDVFVGELMDAPFAGDRFDVLVMLNILEHLPDPERYVAQARQMVAPGGTFWIELPNVASFTARVTGKNWLHHDPAHHLWSFDRAGIARLVGRHGFVVDRIYAHNWEFNPIGCMQSWLNWLPGRKNVLFGVVRRGFSRNVPSIAREVADLVLAAALLPLAIVVSWCEGVSGNGQVLLIRARKSGPAA
jgi:SAM-dependent methyltransferase